MSSKNLYKKKFLEWPSQSPYFHTVEFLWDELKRFVHGKEYLQSSKQEQLLHYVKRGMMMYIVWFKIV